MIKIEIKATNKTLRQDKSNFINYLCFDNYSDVIDKNNDILKYGVFNVYLNIDNEAKQIVLVCIDAKTLIKWINYAENTIPFARIECDNIKVEFEDFKGIL